MYTSTTESCNGDFYVRSLAAFIKTHERQLANALQLYKKSSKQKSNSVENSPVVETTGNDSPIDDPTIVDLTTSKNEHSNKNKHKNKNKVENSKLNPNLSSNINSNSNSNSNSNKTKGKTDLNNGDPISNSNLNSNSKEASLVKSLQAVTLSNAASQVKASRLSLTPHHLFYLLHRFEELGISIGPMNVRLETLNHDASPVNYVSFLNYPSRKLQPDTMSIKSTNSVKSLMSGVSSLWSKFVNNSSADKLEKNRLVAIQDVKYIYSAFTKIPCLRLAPDPRARLIEGFEEYPFDTAVPLLIFKNLSALEIVDIDIRAFFGWDFLAPKLKYLVIRRANIEDPLDVIYSIVVDDVYRRKRPSASRSSANYSSNANLHYNKLNTNINNTNHPTNFQATSPISAPNLLQNTTLTSNIIINNNNQHKVASRSSAFHQSQHHSQMHSTNSYYQRHNSNLSTSHLNIQTSSSPTNNSNFIPTVSSSLPSNSSSPDPPSKTNNNNNANNQTNSFLLPPPPFPTSSSSSCLSSYTQNTNPQPRITRSPSVPPKPKTNFTRSRSSTNERARLPTSPVIFTNPQGFINNQNHNFNQTSNNASSRRQSFLNRSDSTASTGSSSTPALYASTNSNTSNNNNNYKNMNHNQYQFQYQYQPQLHTSHSLHNGNSTRWKYLKHLSLADNNLSNFSQEAVYPLINSLVSLDLSHNKFTQIPESLALLSNLKTLNLSHNLIDSLQNLCLLSTQDQQNSLDFIRSVSASPLSTPLSTNSSSSTSSTSSISSSVFPSHSTPLEPFNKASSSFSPPPPPLPLQSLEHSFKGLLVLNLRANNLSSFQGIEVFTGLIKLDLRDNKLVSASTPLSSSDNKSFLEQEFVRLSPLYLPKLIELNLLGNPFTRSSSWRITVFNVFRTHIPPSSKFGCADEDSFTTQQNNDNLQSNDIVRKADKSLDNEGNVEVKYRDVILDGQSPGKNELKYLMKPCFFTSSFDCSDCIIEEHGKNSSIIDVETLQGNEYEENEDSQSCNTRENDLNKKEAVAKDNKKTNKEKIIVPDESHGYTTTENGNENIDTGVCSNINLELDNTLDANRSSILSSIETNEDSSVSPNTPQTEFHINSNDSYPLKNNIYKKKKKEY